VSASINNNDLVLCYATLPDVSFRTRVECASHAGFQAISLFPEGFHKARENEGLSAADMKKILADNNIYIAELDPMLSWIPDIHPTNDEEIFYRIAESIGARSINVVHAGVEQLPEHQIVAALGGLCERAAKYDLLVHIEFLPWTQINSITSAYRIVEQVNQINLGIMFDSWHHFRSQTDNSDLLKIPGSSIFAIQLNDAPQNSAYDIFTETLQHRLLPGEGDINLREIISYFKQIGVTAPVGIEVFSLALSRIAPQLLAKNAYQSIKNLLR